MEKVQRVGINEKLIILRAKKYQHSDIYLKGNINENYYENYASRQNLNVSFKEYININCSTAYMNYNFQCFCFLFLI